MTALFDSHCHLYAPQFTQDLEEVIIRAQENEVLYILVPGEDISSIEKTINLCAKHQPINIFAAAGIHPHNAENFKGDHSKLNHLAQDKSVLAIGEIGLDYHYMHSAVNIQKEVFIDCLNLALQLEKPVVLHNRESTPDMLSILEKWIEKIPSHSFLKTHPGVFHAFNGDPDILEFALDNHFYAGIGGLITFKNATQLRSVVQKIPMDRILVETDSPYLAPHPHRGKRNEPANVLLVAQKLAQLFSLSQETVIEQTTQNAMELFGIKRVK